MADITTKTWSATPTSIDMRLRMYVSTFMRFLSNLDKFNRGFN
jgi:hypothetical protein